MTEEFSIEERNGIFEEILMEMKPILAQIALAEIDVFKLEKQLEEPKMRRHLLIRILTERIAAKGLMPLDADESAEVSLIISDFLEQQLASEKIREGLPKNGSEADSVTSYELTAFFEDIDHLQVKISGKECGERIIDLVASVKSNIDNLSHPIVARAIHRLWKTAQFYGAEEEFSRKTREANSAKGSKKIRTKERVAFEALQRLAHAITDGIPKEYDATKIHPWDMLTMALYSVDFFTKIHEILNSKALSQYKTASNKLGAFSREFNKAFPDRDSSKVCAWFKDRLKHKGLPCRLTPEALRNNFWAWKLQTKRTSAKNTLSSANKELANRVLEVFSEGFFDRVFDEVIDQKLAIETFPGYTSLEELRFKI